MYYGIEMHAHNAAMSESLGLRGTFWRSRHICTKAHAAIASFAVHSRGAVYFVSGTSVENAASKSGDYYPQ